MKKQKLNELIAKVDKAFGIDKKPSSDTYIYHIGRINKRWCLNVVDDWHQWFANKHMTTDFYGYSPEEAITSFLSYIKLHKIDPYKWRCKE